MVFEKLTGHLKFSSVGKARVGEPKSGFNLAIEIPSGQLEDPARKGLRPLQGEFAVQERERLPGTGGHVAARTTLVSVRHVETFEHRVTRVAFYEHVDAASV